MSPVWAVAAAALIAGAGHRLRWLTGNGALAAVGVGTGVLAGAAVPGAALLGTFFVTGSVLTRWSASVRDGHRAGARNATQVLANGWTAVVGALAIPLAPHFGWPVLLGGLAAAQADTWATEIGMHAGRPPLLISTLKRVPVGTSGGVTVRGTAGGVLGATLLVAIAVPFAGGVVAAGGLIGGVLGMTLDSLLGATVQRHFHCDVCDESSPTMMHGCGKAARHARGAMWVTNDVVNAIASGAGALAALACARIWS